MNMGIWYMKAGIKSKGDNKATKQQSNKVKEQESNGISI